MYALDVENESVPDIWQALSDPTRRRLLERLQGGPLSTSALCDGVPHSRFGVMRHLGVLERAGLVVHRKQGRHRLNHFNAAPLVALYNRWLTPRVQVLGTGLAKVAALSEGSVMETKSPQPLGSIDVVLDWTIAASVQKVWTVLCNDIDSWWPTHHRVIAPASRMTLNPVVGGALSELTDGGGGVEWYRVYAVDPRKSIDFTGQLASRYGGPATSLLNISLEPGAQDGTTVLKLTDSLFGRLAPDMLASTTSGWQDIIGGGLVKRAGVRP